MRYHNWLSELPVATMKPKEYRAQCPLGSMGSGLFGYLHKD